jgi:hypothetical protein
VVENAHAEVRTIDACEGHAGRTDGVVLCNRLCIDLFDAIETFERYVDVDWRGGLAVEGKCQMLAVVKKFGRV